MSTISTHQPTHTNHPASTTTSQRPTPGDLGNKKITQIKNPETLISNNIKEYNNKNRIAKFFTRHFNFKSESRFTARALKISNELHRALKLQKSDPKSQPSFDKLIEYTKQITENYRGSSNEDLTIPLFKSILKEIPVTETLSACKLLKENIGKVSPTFLDAIQTVENELIEESRQAYNNKAQELAQSLTAVKIDDNGLNFADFLINNLKNLEDVQNHKSVIDRVDINKLDAPKALKFRQEIIESILIKSNLDLEDFFKSAHQIEALEHALTDLVNNDKFASDEKRQEATSLSQLSMVLKAAIDKCAGKNLESYKGEINSLEPPRLKEITNEIINLTNDVVAHRKDLRDLKRNVDTKTSDLKNKIDSIKNNENPIKDEIKLMENEINSMEDKINSLENQINSMEDKIKNLDTEHKNLLKKSNEENKKINQEITNRQEVAINTLKQHIEPQFTK